MSAKKQVLEVIGRLRKEYPEPGTALTYTTPFELLVATVLSAQATDVLVNKVTQTLFRKYPSVMHYAEAPLEALQKDVSSLNFYKTKAKNIQAAAKMVIGDYGSKVPQRMEELTKLPGVARKTANIILFNAFGINEGIAVDTHVNRLANRLGLTKQDDPVKVEADLMKIVPRAEWGVFSHLLILHGRKVCQARKPNHHGCVLFDLCPSRDL